MADSTSNPPILIFDLGGVFIELTGSKTMEAWTRGRYTTEELWRIWLSSTYVKEFESGRMDAETFAQGIVDEYNLPVNAKEFLCHFSTWSNRLYPGTRRLLTELRGSYTLASLSNTNAIHWSSLCNNLNIDRYFHYNFPSHKVGNVKPEIEIFSYVIEHLSYPPELIYFFDDIQVNVEQARNAGLQAYNVVGLEHLNETLMELSFL